MQSSLWQPIETAPKDGTWLLVYETNDSDGYQPTIHVVHWGIREWDGSGKTWVTMALGPNPDTYDADRATHWMPLPEPPK